jgi:hypothetical protein
MKSLVLSENIRLPKGARLVEAKAFYSTTARPGDTYTERLVMDLNCHDVQILRYDCNDNGVIVYIDRRAATMHLSAVTGYIERNAL